jgi:transcriptional regulator with XRE-family HTH domain
MSRFHQRLRAALRNPEVAAGYRAAAAERALQDALEHIREQQGLTKEQLAERMGRHREAISRLLTAPDSNPTLETLISLFEALGVTAEITFRHAKAGDLPIRTRVLVHASTLNGANPRHVTLPAFISSPIPAEDTAMAPVTPRRKRTRRAQADTEG